MGSAVLSALIAGGIAVPAAADPPVGSKITAIPDAGLRPQADGLPTLPFGSLSQPRTLPQTAQAALQAQYTAAELELSVLGARRSELYQAYTNAVVAKAMADYAWRATADTLRAAKEAAEAAAVAEYQAAVKAPPRLGDSLGELGQLIPRTESTPETEAVLADLGTAQHEERQAYTVLTSAISAEQQSSTAYSAVEKEFKRKEIAFLELKRRLAELQSEADRVRERQEQNLGNYSPGKSNAGLVAAAKAQKAVLFALSQRGKPYRWGDEGPNTYDCSGLMLASYKAAGITLNRVAKDQYYGTRNKSVSKYALLPGDLVFFATDPSDWRTIHHVGMYLGDGKMVHAPRTGDVVRPASVSLSSIDFATRVVDAVAAPNQPSPTKSPTPSPTKTTSPSPTATTSPSSSSSPSAAPASSSPPPPKPAESPSPEPPAAESPKPTPTPTPTPAPAPAA
ncbi:C40 family peptidase [Catellatospora methionotrophica]|uniref:C40 family peptidase n=1 Tax=Catellatospora methionotrophica TaxID=121620 RepID=UPI00140E5A46|nr:C40 family peptidase [Catellatospora methionotrophica]